VGIIFWEGKILKRTERSNKRERGDKECTYRCIRVEHDGGRLFLSVIRFLIAGQFTLVNFYGTGELHQRL